MWIYPLIFLLISLIVFGYFKYSEVINRKLSKKKMYLRSANGLTNVYRGRSKATLTLSIVLVLMLIVMINLPYTNGYIKSMSKDLQPTYLEDNYLVNREERFQNERETVNKIKRETSTTNIVKLAKRVVFLDGKILVSKIIGGDETKHQYVEDFGECKLQIVLTGNKVVAYYSYKNEASEYQSKVYIHNIDNLEIYDTIEINGMIKKVYTVGEKLNLVIANELVEDEMLILKMNAKNNISEYSISASELYYVDNCKIYQNLTFVTVNLYNYNVSINSLYIGEYEVYLDNNSVYIACNALNSEEEEYGLILKYDFSTLVFSLKTELIGYIYDHIVFRDEKLFITTIEIVDGEKIYHLYVLNTFLWKLSEEVVTMLPNKKGVAINLGSKPIFLSVEDTKYKFSFIDGELILDSNECQFEIFNEHIYKFKTIDGKMVLVDYEITESGFELNGQYELDVISLEVISMNMYEEQVIIVFTNETNVGYIVIENNTIEMQSFEKRETTTIFFVENQVIVSHLENGEKIYQYYQIVSKEKKTL